MKTQLGSEVLKTIQDSVGKNPRPILLSGAAVLTNNTAIGDWAQADLLIVGSIIVGVGPGLLTAAADDKSIVVNCEGMLILPSKIRFNTAGHTGSLTPGDPANVTVIRLKPVTGKNKPNAKANLVDIVLKDGKVEVWDGKSVKSSAEVKAEETWQLSKNDNHQFIGMWIDEKGFVKQELLKDGRYDEARGDRQSAYQGQYWIDNDTIIYLDDLGFWAVGEFKENVLHHAGYTFRKK